MGGWQRQIVVKMGDDEKESDEDEAEDLMENDEVSPEEEAFIRGYEEEDEADEE